MATTDTVNANVTVKFVVHEKGNPPGKLADAELHFNEGLLAGLKLIGFAVWERRSGGGRNVTFPARQYSVNGELRSFALLRPIEDVAAQARRRYSQLEFPQVRLLANWLRMKKCCQHRLLDFTICQSLEIALDVPCKCQLSITPGDVGE